MVQSAAAVNGTNSSSPLNNSAQAGRSYQIQRGDTLSSIAARFGTDVATLAAANGIRNPDRIYAGQSITVPQGRRRKQLYSAQRRYI
ncbi:MAG: LysM peptidoglycan-binding domain-containing protein, partial [Sphingomonadales bacterium]|nr:LysM peptidoglycan-binding domain-containing protein [Sphingomonadales bacterium]